MAENQQHAWQKPELAASFITGIRGVLPLAAEQIDVMLRVVRTAKPKEVTSILDVGGGDGILGRLLLDTYPAARGIFVDFSEPMLTAAKEKTNPERAVFILGDLNNPAWWDALPRSAVPFDVVVSGYAIHHLSDERKRDLYKQIFYLLKPGGVFVNIEHVASSDAWVESLFNEAFIDGLYAMEQAKGDGNMSREQISQRIYSDDADDGDIVTPVETQCAWLRDIGFTHVDCYMKIYALAVFGGVKPTVG